MAAIFFLSGGVVARIENTRFIAEGAIRDEDILLDNNDWLVARNVANNANINILKLDSNDRTVLSLWTFPTADGSAGSVLSTNGSGILSWIPPTSGANQALSNLTTPTAINQNLIPNGSLSLGAGTAPWAGVNGRDFNVYNAGNVFMGNIRPSQTAPDSNVYDVAIRAGLDSAGLALHTFNLTTATRNVFLGTGNVTTGSAASGEISIRSGSTVNGNSGNVIIQSTAPSGSGTRGRVIVNARTLKLPTHSVAPAATDAGEMYYDTVLNKSYTWDGASWQAHW